MGGVLVGTCSWTDPTLLASGFYPKGVNNPQRRLQFYAQHFPIVEVDSTYYALPSEGSVAQWVERTPQDFVFDGRPDGQQQNRRRNLVCAKPLQYGEAVEAWKINIQDNYLVVALTGEIKSFLAVESGVHDITFLLQPLSNETSNLPFIFDYQDSHSHSSLS